MKSNDRPKIDINNNTPKINYNKNIQSKSQNINTDNENELDILKNKQSIIDILIQNQKLVNENNNLKKRINEFNNEVKSLKNKIRTLENDFNQIMTVNFVSLGSSDIGHYSLLCKKTDLFVRLEERLYKDFPKLKNNKIVFEVSAKRINRFKTLDDNNIKNNEIINIFIIN